MGHSELGQELSFGDALKAHTSPNTHHHSSSGGFMMLSDLLEEHGPLAASAMSSPTHTTTFVLPAQQTSPAQLAGLATDSYQDPVSCTLGSQQQQQQLSDPARPQLGGLMTDPSLAAGIAAGDLITFQVDGQIKLGLRPRQLTFSGSAQQAQQQLPQLGPPLYGGNHNPAPATSAALPTAVADMLNFPDAGHSQLSPVPLLPSRAASNASNAFTDITAAGAAVQHDSMSAPAMGSQSVQTASGVQGQGSLLPVGQSSMPASMAITEAAATAELQTGQQLTEVAPSLSWPGAPSRQSSGLPPPLSRQHSDLPPLPARQLSAVVRQTSAVAAAVAPSRQNSSALSRQNSQQQPPPLSRQVSRTHQSASRQGSGVQLPLSRQASAAAAEEEAARHSAEAEEPKKAAVCGPGQGLEQAWAALLPSLLAGASKQHSGASEFSVGPSALLPAMPQQVGNADPKQQTVGDLLKMWAPLSRPAAAGTTPYTKRGR